MLTDCEKEDRSNGTRPPDVKANRVAPDRNNNNNNIDNNMLDSSSSSADDDDDMMPEWHYNMSDEDYDSYYHNDLFVQYNNPPTPKRVHNQDLAPITLLICDTIQNHEVGRPLVILLDGGSSGSLINKRAIPRGAVPSKSVRSHITTTASGSFDTSLTVGLKNIRLPEFSNSRRIEGWNCRIFDSKACQYDIIIGRDFMRHIGIDHFFSTDTIRWIDRSVKMKPPHHYDMMMNNSNRVFEDYNNIIDSEDDEDLREAYAELFEAQEILHRAYKKVTPAECASEQDHMSKEERVKFQAVLERHKVLFDGELDLLYYNITSSWLAEEILRFIVVL